MFTIFAIALRAAKGIARILFEADPAEQRLLEARARGEQIRIMGR